MQSMIDPSVWLEPNLDVRVTVSIREYPDGRGYAFLGVRLGESIYSTVLPCGSKLDINDLPVSESGW